MRVDLSDLGTRGVWIAAKQRNSVAHKLPSDLMIGHPRARTITSPRVCVGAGYGYVIVYATEVL